MVSATDFRIRIGRSGNGFDRTVGRQGNLGDVADDTLEGIVTSNEVGFGVDFDDNGRCAGAGNADEAFGSRAARLLVSLGDALGAQPVDRGFHVAGGLGECLLAVHHACAALFAQFLYQCSRDFSHYLPLVGWYGALTASAGAAPGLRDEMYPYA